MLSEDIRQSIRMAKDPATPVEKLIVLATHGESRVREAVFFNPNTPLNAVLLVLDSIDWSLKIKFAEKTTDPARLELLTRDYEKTVVTTALSNPHATREILQNFIESENLNILKGILRNPKTPNALIELIWIRKGTKLKAEIAAHTNTPAYIFKNLYKEGNRYINSALAGNRSTPEEVLIQMARSDQRQSRVELLNREHIPHSVIEILMKDQDSAVRERILAISTQYNKWYAKTGQYYHKDAVKEQSVGIDSLALTKFPLKEPRLPQITLSDEILKEFINDPSEKVAKMAIYCISDQIYLAKLRLIGAKHLQTTISSHLNSLKQETA